MNDNDFLQHYLGELNTQGQNATAASVPATDQSGQSEHSSHGHRAGLEQAKPQQQSCAGEQSRDPEGQSTGPSEDSEAAASPTVKEGAHQDTGNSDHKPGKHAAKLRSQDLQEKNRKAQRRFRERQKVSVTHSSAISGWYLNVFYLSIRARASAAIFVQQVDLKVCYKAGCKVCQNLCHSWKADKWKALLSAVGQGVRAGAKSCRAAARHDSTSAGQGKPGEQSQHICSCPSDAR